MGCVGLVARIKEMRNAYIILLGRSERKGPHGRPKRRFVDTIKIDLREIGRDIVATRAV
jgi:hypothetical protein